MLLMLFTHVLFPGVSSISKAKCQIIMMTKGSIIPYGTGRDEACEVPGCGVEDEAPELSNLRL